MITVVGSLNIDMNIGLKEHLKKGQTLMSDSFDTSFGGKGGNQAIAAARLGAKVQFIGAVGQDSEGDAYLSHLKAEGIDVTGISRLACSPTGRAFVLVAEKDNAIVVVPGANMEITEQSIKEHERLIANSQFLVLQFEVSDQVIATTLELAKKHGIPTILNPAPFREFPKEWLDLITYITPNQTEYQGILKAGMQIPPEKLILTLGSEGACFYTNGEQKKVGPPQVDVVDTTGAGDTFNGVLAAFLSQGSSLEEACYKAVVAASLSTEAPGAQAGMPNREILENKLSEIEGK